MNKRKRKFGDRIDAKLCRDVMGMNQICIDLKPKRSLSEIYINQKMDVTNLVKYINKQNQSQKLANKLTYFHAFAMAVGKTIYNRPLLNRFIANRRMYEHNNISLSYVMKIAFNDKSEEVMVIMPVEEKDTLFTLSKKIYDKVERVRKKGDTGSGANKAIHVLSKLPNMLRVPIVGIFKFFDKKGLLPKTLIEDNIYYSSMLVSNIGTLKCDGIYHNITDFGTCSGIIVMGEIKEEEFSEKGKIKKKYYCDFGVTIDERIADGFYFIKSLKLIQYLFNNPELLEEEANEKIEIEERS